MYHLRQREDGRDFNAVWLIGRKRLQGISALEQYEVLECLQDETVLSFLEERLLSIVATSLDNNDVDTLSTL
jgi:hypothetical protein